MKLPDELEGLISTVEWKESLKETEDSLIEYGQFPTAEPIISKVQSVKVLKFILAADDDLNLAPTEIKRAYLGLSNEGDFQSSSADYRKHKWPEYGRRNPDRMDYPFWRDMVGLGRHAYSARQQFNDTESLYHTERNHQGLESRIIRPQF